MLRESFLIVHVSLERLPAEFGWSTGGLQYRPAGEACSRVSRPDLRILAESVVATSAGASVRLEPSHSTKRVSLRLR
jgi:hypothetical protein